MVTFKNRYLLMEVYLDPNGDLGRIDPIRLTQFNVTKAIKNSILTNFGECGLASSLVSLQVKYVNPITKVCLIRIARDEYQKIWSAITMVRSIGECPVMFNTLTLSGCIRACKVAALNCDKAKFEEYKLMMRDGVTPEVTEEVYNSFDKIKALEP